MITITLVGGPKDGENYTIDTDSWRSGYLKVIDNIQSIKWVDFSEINSVSDMSINVLIYKKTRWNQGWACLVLGWDGCIKPMAAAKPEYKWVFEGYKW